MSDFRAGDRVYVTDPGLAQLRAIMRHATGNEIVNHHGTVESVLDDDGVVMLLIVFDEDGVAGAGNAAPYPPSEVRALTSTEKSPDA